MSNQTHVEVSPDVRKSASERMREVDVSGFPPGCTECGSAKTFGERLVSVRAYLSTATLSDSHPPTVARQHILT